MPADSNKTGWAGVSILGEIVCMVGVMYVYVGGVFGFYVVVVGGGGFSHCLFGCFSMIVWTPAVLSVLSACVLYFFLFAPVQRK